MKIIRSDYGDEEYWYSVENNTDPKKEMESMVQTIVNEMGASLLCRSGNWDYWVCTGGSVDVYFQTKITVDKDYEFPSDDEDAGLNKNYKKFVLYLDVPNKGYLNWNSSQGFVTERDLEYKDHIINKFISYLRTTRSEATKNAHY